MSRRTLLGIVFAVCTVLPLAACSSLVGGTAVSVFSDPFSVAGMRATDGPSGLRPDAEKPSRTVNNTDGGAVDNLAASAVSDLEEFWADSYSEVFKGQFQPVRALISWDAESFDTRFCGMETYGLVNAAFCKPDRTIGWDRGVLMPGLRRHNGDMGAVMVLAHEYGHAIQQQAGLVTRNTPTLVAEQQADCLAGTYMRWVAHGDSPRFALSTADGLNNLLAAVIAFRDPLLTEAEAQVGINEHGSAFERISAFQFGFTEGPAACAAIDIKEINQRRGELPVLLPENQSGDLDITDRWVRSMVDALNTVFKPANPPQLSFRPDTAVDCPSAQPSPPASYCPDTNTIVIDLAELQALAAPPDDFDIGGLAGGDNTAFSVLISRYMLALQHARGLVLDNAEAALRTACLTGVATAKMIKPVNLPNGDTILLTAGDVDEAVSGILTNGLAASDVNGESVPSGFARIDAFRVGILGDEQRCLKRFA
ncbi:MULTISPECIES: neutral zinc metallopeptidase [unclassified Mycolicibacterium]|uniref:neutral zinc metallopeptidase n=1 Tax=unclassified Mycolicibacterium TaxID=2636767 RepID=UPI0012DE3B63|nr:MULTISPECIES: neutral zinc metallopeptidase [unclassified Mycolicibacterium]MUL83272.1 peptidase [Mycolicibacterium sp. CBMA 329]MUL90263.1 peptidase [Mycolicibacterium sp. CBMA 331]MUM00237.1 peptidase [Mycolicibacterium sp. CBMA 334]MUM26655.1 peptidase [Mycolicibacterium sp. CBMA 295]MUM41207.1 peptidase [Mycolicibacterium sp. CBMA 247]